MAWRMCPRSSHRVPASQGQEGGGSKKQHVKLSTQAAQIHAHTYTERHVCTETRVRTQRRAHTHANVDIHTYKQTDPMHTPPFRARVGQWSMVCQGRGISSPPEPHRGHEGQINPGSLTPSGASVSTQGKGDALSPTDSHQSESRRSCPQAPCRERIRKPRSGRDLLRVPQPSCMELGLEPETSGSGLHLALQLHSRNQPQG